MKQDSEFKIQDHETPDGGEPEAGERLPENEYPTLEDAGVGKLSGDSGQVAGEERDEAVGDGDSSIIEQEATVSVTPADVGRQISEAIRGTRPVRPRAQKKTGRPVIEDGIAGLMTRTHLEDRHITEYVRRRTIEWVRALGGTDAIPVEHDIMISGASACLETCLHAQAALRKDPTIMNDPSWMRAFAQNAALLMKYLKALGVKGLESSKKPGGQRDISGLLAVVARSQKKRKV